MPIPEQFMTEEFLRYTVECQRMASLSGNPAMPAAPQAGVTKLWADWIARVGIGYLQPQERLSVRLASR
jgi:hypothetical protein